MEFIIIEAIGTGGVFCCLMAFLLLQLEKIDPKKFLYSFLNFIGGGAILVSLYFEWNLPAALMEGSWVLISLYGILHYYQRRRVAAKQQRQ